MESCFQWVLVGPPVLTWGQTSPPPSGAPALQGGAQGHSSSLFLAPLVHGASVFPASEHLLSLSLAVEPAGAHLCASWEVGRTTGRCVSEGMKGPLRGRSPGVCGLGKQSVCVSWFHFRCWSFRSSPKVSGEGRGPLGGKWGSRGGGGQKRDGVPARWKAPG